MLLRLVLILQLELSFGDWLVQPGNLEICGGSRSHDVDPSRKCLPAADCGAYEVVVVDVGTVAVGGVGRGGGGQQR